AIPIKAVREVPRKPKTDNIKGAVTTGIEKSIARNINFNKSLHQKATHIAHRPITIVVSLATRI
uniref:hypothetical protein n=1 Tax=Candidatus Cardinium sp. cBcalN1 TaxID=2699437 RepID=UPI001FB438F3